MASPQEQLNELYRRVFGRDVDPSGLSTYAPMLSRPTGLLDIEQDLLRSGEFQGMARRRSTEEFAPALGEIGLLEGDTQSTYDDLIRSIGDRQKREPEEMLEDFNRRGLLRDTRVSEGVQERTQELGRLSSSAQRERATRLGMLAARKAQTIQSRTGREQEILGGAQSSLDQRRQLFEKAQMQREMQQMELEKARLALAKARADAGGDGGIDLSGLFSGASAASGQPIQFSQKRETPKPVELMEDAQRLIKEGRSDQEILVTMQDLGVPEKQALAILKQVRQTPVRFSPRYLPYRKPQLQEKYSLGNLFNRGTASRAWNNLLEGRF